jgi:hypothetical protein
MTWVAFTASLVSMVVGLIAIFNFSQTRKAAAMEEGKKAAKFDMIDRDLKSAWEEIRYLKGCEQNSGKVLVEIQITLKYIKETVEEIKEDWKRHMKEG